MAAGRKGKYAEWLTEESLKRVESWAMDGLSDKQIASNMGISQTTFYDWIKKYSQLSKAIKRGKRPADFEVENALYKSAVGYEVEEVKTVVEQLANGKKVQRVEKTVKYINPNPTAMIFWLTNRKPWMWKRNGSESADGAGSGVVDWKEAVVKAAEKRLEGEEATDGEEDYDSGGD